MTQLVIDYHYYFLGTVHGAQCMCIIIRVRQSDKGGQFLQ